MFDNLIFDSLVFDIARRNPRCEIVFNGFYYYLLNGLKKIPVKREHIEELISREFVTKNKHNGLEVTEKAIEFTDSLMTIVKVENHGKFFDRQIAPKEYGEV